MLQLLSTQIEQIRQTNAWKAAIVGGICLLAFGLGRMAEVRLVFLVAAGVVGVTAFAVLNRDIGLGLLALVPISFWIPFEVGTGTKVSINLTVIWLIFLVGVWLAKEFIGNKRLQLVPSPINVPALLFILSATLSLLGGNLNWIMLASQRASLFAQLGGWLLIVLSIIALLFMGNQINSKHYLKLFTWLYLLAGGIFVVSIFTPFVGGVILRRFNGPATTTVFRTLVTALAMGQCLFNKELDRKWRVGLGILAILTVYIGWRVDKSWISGWLPPLLAIWIILWLKNWRLGLAITILGALVLSPMWPRAFAQINNPAQQYSTESRLSTWPIMFDLIKASPIIGLGPANYYYYTPLYSLQGWYVNFNSHNNFLDILAQTGFVGLLIFLWLVWEISRQGWKLRSSVEDGFSQGYINGVLAGFAACLISGMMADWFLPFLYNIGIPGFRASVFLWIFLGGLTSIEIIQKKSADSNSQVPGV